MNDVQAKSSICKIFHRQDDGTEVVFGCGCLVKCGETLKVATSWKIRNLTGGEVFAKFSTMQDREIKLRIDTKRGEREGIAYNSLDETAFEQIAFEHRPEGISIANLGENITNDGEIEACRVPVLEKMDQLGDRKFEIEFYNVVKNQSENRYTLQIQSGNNCRVIDSLRQSDKYHSLVLGAPILDDNFKFLGIVDFLEVGDDSLLELIYHGIQRTPIAESRRQAGLQEPQGTVQVSPEVKMKCIFKLATGGMWLAGSAYLVYKYSNDLEALKTLVNEVILPIGSFVRDIVFGSIMLVVRVTTIEAVEELWQRYESGQLKRDLAEKVFDIEKMKAEANVEKPLDLIVKMSEEEFRKAKEQLTSSFEKVKQSPIRQETDSGIQTKFSPGDSLAKLWNYNIDFRDGFSKELNRKHKDIQYWPHLADKFGIEKKIYEAFSTSDITSPTETMLEYLAVYQPTLKIKEFCKSLEAAYAFEVCSIVKDSVKAGDLSEKDKVTKICDKAPGVSDDIILKLDREERLWRNLARERKIPEDIYSTFERDRADNPTRVFFDVLQTRKPYLNVKNFKEKVTKLNLENIIEVLNEFKISDDMPLEDLSKHPDAKIEIENILNNPKTEFLWNLASLYQKEGMMEDIDIQKAFRKQEDVHSPTEMVMEYVISSMPGNHTIKDLIIKLVNMKRDDCLRIIGPYLKGGNEDIAKIKQGIEKFQGGASGDRRQVSPTNVEPNGVAVTDQSDTTNPYVFRTATATSGNTLP